MVLQWLGLARSRYRVLLQARELLLRLPFDDIHEHRHDSLFHLFREKCSELDAGDSSELRELDSATYEAIHIREGLHQRTPLSAESKKAKKKVAKTLNCRRRKRRRRFSRRTGGQRRSFRRDVRQFPVRFASSRAFRRRSSSVGCCQYVFVSFKQRRCFRRSSSRAFRRRSSSLRSSQYVFVVVFALVALRIGPREARARCSE